MRENIEKCLHMLARHEGGYVDDKADSGGPTDWGISTPVYEAWIGHEVSAEEMAAIPYAVAEKIYRQEYWEVVHGDELPSGVDWAVFDWAVNAGPSGAAKGLQNAVSVVADGIIGPQTIAATHAEQPNKIIDKIAVLREAQYRGSKSFNTYKKGWLRRNEDTRVAALEMAKGQ
ncbi:hypothetical protein N9W44_06930 [Alphaproteobacteria bacterium]|nr:hypothetical protein [Alphaproteobacteria bacterium]